MRRIIFAAGLAILFILIFLILVNFYLNLRYQSQKSQTDQKNTEITRTLTVDELKEYDGTDVTLPIYLALDGLVYDVSAGQEFYAPGGAYHYLAGKDSTVLLRLIGGDIIKRKYPVVGKLVR